MIQLEFRNTGASFSKSLVLSLTSDYIKITNCVNLMYDSPKTDKSPF